MRHWADGVNLAEAIAGEMARRDLTYKEVADAIGTSTTNVERWRKQGTIPAGPLAQALMEWLETDITGFGRLVAVSLLSRGERAAPR